MRAVDRWASGTGWLWFAALVLAGCATQVEPIDIHDRTIPVEARKLVADARDSIAVARAERDEAERRLGEVERWHRDVLARDWPSSASSLRPTLRSLASARVRLAELRVERAEHRVRLARAEYRLLTAKTALRQDLAVYDLAPLRERVRHVESRIEELDETIDDRQKRVAKLSEKWWAAYARFVDDSGSADAFFAVSSPSPDADD
ncbi:MAG: hypothetical protein ABEL76_09180 [Bradymonadaceae bacterium]